MKKITFYLFALCCFAFSWQGQGQILINEALESGVPDGWTSSYYYTTTTEANICQGTGALYNNFFYDDWDGIVTNGDLTSPNYEAVSNETDTTVEFKWLAKPYSTNAVDYLMYVEYSSNDGTDWNLISSFAVTETTTCAQYSEVIPAASLPSGSDFKFRIRGEWQSGDSYFYLDDILVSQAISDAPSCDAALIETTNVSVVGDISWSTATGAPSSYDLTVGTSTGASDVLATTDVGNVTNYNLGILAFSTTYYVTIVPKNDNGLATGCVEQTFVTKGAPTLPTVDVVFDINECGDSETYNVAYSSANQQFVWIQLNYVGGCDSITVDTEGTDFDTEIGLYDSNGLLISSNDDGGTGSLSSITDGTLTAGTYYIIAGSYNTVFGTDGFEVSSTNITRVGTIYVNASSPSNETADFNNLQYPFEATVEEGNTTDVYAQIKKTGITEPAGQGAGIQAWIGVSDIDATSATDFETTDWTWIAATYNTDNGDNDEYQATLGEGLAVGTYFYVSRFSVLNGPFTYGGINPGASDGNTWDGTNFVSGELTVTAAPPPANDDCSGAIALTAGGTFEDNPTDGSVSYATADAETNGCGSNGPGVWYSVVVPDSGDITIETAPDAATGDIGFDSLIEAFSGTCGALISIDCDDDDSAGLYSLLELTGLTPGSTIYIRVWESGGDAEEPFSISAYSASLGVNNFETEAAFSYHPNPVKNTLTLNAQDTIEQVAMYNMLGQEVLRARPNSVDSDLDMSNLQTGTYFVKVTIANVTETIRVIKQ